MAMLWLLLLLLVAGSVVAGGESGTSKVSWVSFDEGLDAVKRGGGRSSSSNKLLVVVISKPWCSACATLDRVFAESADVQQLSEQFVMSRLASEEATGKIFQLDGKYYPRMLFVDHHGDILQDLQNFAAPSHSAYTYSSEAEVAETMRRALDLVSARRRGGEL